MSIRKKRECVTQQEGTKFWLSVSRYYSLHCLIFVFCFYPNIFCCFVLPHLFVSWWWSHIEVRSCFRYIFRCCCLKYAFDAMICVWSYFYQNRKKRIHQNMMWIFFDWIVFAWTESSSFTVRFELIFFSRLVFEMFYLNCFQLLFDIIYEVILI